MKRWNPKSGQYEPFSPGERTYPPLPAELAAQMVTIPKTTDDMGVTYCPCQAILADGRVIERVLLAEAASYIRVWGVWPDQNGAKFEIKIEDVIRLEESPWRLPAPFAQKLYDAGESGMGYCVYELEYQDGSRSAYVAGNAIDFTDPAIGQTMADIIAVHPHEGSDHHPAPTPNYFWCLYGKG